MRSMKNELANVVTCIFDRTIIYLESPHVRLFLIDVTNLYKRFFSHDLGRRVSGSVKTNFDLNCNCNCNCNCEMMNTPDIWSSANS